MAGKQCEFSAKKAGKRPLFEEIWLEFQILYQWTPCIRKVKFFRSPYVILT